MSDVRGILLTQGKVAIVDAVDYEWLMQWKWHFSGVDGYALRNTERVNGKHGCELMHRVILCVADDVLVDHIDNDGLNNTRGNLRQATKAQVAWNSPSHRDATSKYKGVCWDSGRGRWLVAIMAHGKRKHVGRFDNEIDAARAYDRAARAMHGEFAYLNFPAVQP